MRSRVWLLVWVLAIIFPAAALRRFSPQLRLAFDGVFAPQYMHILMHLLLFSGLVMLLIYTFRLKLERRSMLLLLAAVLVAGVLQETTQAIERGWFWLGGSIFDLGVDLAGGLLGLGLTALIRRSRARSARPGNPG